MLKMAIRAAKVVEWRSVSTLSGVPSLRTAGASGRHASLADNSVILLTVSNRIFDKNLSKLNQILFV